MFFTHFSQNTMKRTFFRTRAYGIMGFYFAAVKKKKWIYAENFWNVFNICRSWEIRQLLKNCWFCTAKISANAEPVVVNSYPPDFVGTTHLQDKLCTEKFCKTFQTGKVCLLNQKTINSIHAWIYNFAKQAISGKIKRKKTIENP